MRFNIFRNPFIDAQVGYLMDIMVDARRQETEEYWRGVLEKECQDNAIQAYNNGYTDGYGDSYMKGYYDGATRSGKYHDDLVEWIGDDLL